MNQPPTTDVHAAPVPDRESQEEPPREPASDGVDRSGPGRPPRLAEGIELLGEYEGSGFKEAPYLARRADGQTLQLTRLLYAVAESADGRRDFAAIAEAVSAELGR